MFAVLVRSLVLTLAIVAAALPAAAATFEVDPVSLTFAGGQKSADVVVTNTGSDTVRFSLRAYVWTQNAQQPQRLAETDDLLFFPELFTLLPGASQRVRVGLMPAPVESERAYRLAISELPPKRVPGGGPRSANLTILTRITIPVFQSATADERAQPGVAAIAPAGHGKVRVELTNRGNVHLPPSTVDLEAADASGRTLLRQSQDVWYVLGSSTVSNVFALPSRTCPAVRTLRFQWHAFGATLSRSIGYEAGDCR